MTEVGGSAPVRPTGLAERALAPDLARGAMLLLIALANAHVYLYEHPIGPRGYPLGLDPASQWVALAQTTLVDGRAYPMFGLLFGYGIVQLSRRFDDPVVARQLVRRRGWSMALIGGLHGVLLWAGDIVAAYGLLSVILAGRLVSGRDRKLVTVFVSGLVVAALFGLLIALPSPPGSDTMLPSVGEPNAATATLYRAAEFLGIGLVMNMVLVFGAVAAGAWAGRRRLLDDPAAHRVFLRRAAVGGLAAAVLGGLPLALMTSGFWTTPGLGAAMAAGSLHTVTGYAGGIGYAALFGLLAARLGTARLGAARGGGELAGAARDSATRDSAAGDSEARAGEARGPVVRALVACGQRSLTCYLAQSVVFVALLAALGAGLGDQLTIAWTALFAFATWLLILLGAALMARRGIRGPAEVLLRRLTYRSA